MICQTLLFLIDAISYYTIDDNVCCAHAHDEFKKLMKYTSSFDCDVFKQFNSSVDGFDQRINVTWTWSEGKRPPLKRPHWLVLRGWHCFSRRIETILSLLQYYKFTFTKDITKMTLVGSVRHGFGFKILCLSRYRGCSKILHNHNDDYFKYNVNFWKTTYHTIIIRFRPWLHIK